MPVGDLGERILEIGLGIHAVELRRLGESVHGSCLIAAGIGAGEEVVLAPQRNCPFILPMSGRNLKSITAGIPILVARSASGRSRNALTVAYVRLDVMALRGVVVLIRQRGCA